MSTTTYNQNISVGNVQLNNVYSSTDAISQAASLPPCTTPAGTNAIQGTTSLVTTAPTYGTAGFFPGPTGNYLNFGAANPVNYDTVSTNLFVECWYYAIGPGGGGDGRLQQMCAVSGPTVSSTEKWGLLYCNSAINYVQFFMYTTVSGTATSAFANGTLNYGNWYHLAGSWDSTTKTCYAFLNGIVGAAAVMGGVPKAFDALTHEFMIGADFKTGNTAYGYMRDLRVIKGGTARTTSFTPDVASAPFNTTALPYIIPDPIITSPITSGLVGWYDQTSWNQAGQTWGDKTGNGNTMTKTRGTVNSVSNYVYGTTADTLVFPVGILTSTYTLFHVTKYNGATLQRIFSSGSGANWLSGHLIGNSGVAYHDGWVGTELNYHGSNWVMSTDQRFLYRSNAVLRGTAGGGSVPTNLGINNDQYGQYSDWACAETIVYNRQLTQDEINSTENYLNAKYPSFSLLPVPATNIFTLLNQWSSSNNAAAITQWIQKTVNKIGQPTPTAVSGTAVTFPSAALTSTNSTIAEGTYLVFSSSEYDGSTVSWNAFNKVINTTQMWHSALAYNASGGYTGSNSLGGVSGEWLMIGLPYRVALTSYTLHIRNDGYYTQGPVSFTILGSNDRVTYTTVNTQTGQNWASGVTKTYTVTGSAAYQYYAIVTQVTGASGQAWVVSLTEWILVGNYNTTVTTFGNPFWSSNTSNYNYTQVAVPNNAGGAGGNGGWAGCVTVPDGRVIVAPQIPTATSIGIFNPNTNAFTTVAAGGLGGDYTYAGGAALAGNGTAILAPFRTTAIGIYNPSTNIFTTTTGGLTGNPGHAGACMLPNGKIMFAPYDSGRIGVFDPATNIYTTGPTIAGYTGGRHAGCVPLPDGRVILCPQTGTVIGIYDYITNTYTTAAGVSGIVSGAYFNGGLLPNGNVAFIPIAATNIGLYNPNTNSFTTVPIGVTGFFGGKLLPNGLLMCNPYNTANYGLYNYVTGAFTTGPATGSGAGGVCQSSGLLLDGRVIFPPFVNGSNMGIYTGVTTPPPPEFVLHPLFNHGG